MTKKCLNFAVAVLMGSMAAGQQAVPPARERLVGTWKLVSIEAVSKEGAIRRPYGTDPIGRISYDRGGRMSAQWMRRDRKAGSGADTAQAQLDEFDSYFGTFELDESSHTVIHHVEGALNPNMIGTDRRRSYEFVGKRLVLSYRLDDSTSKVVWERLPD
jgi:hypothetical protein